MYKHVCVNNVSFGISSKNTENKNLDYMQVEELNKIKKILNPKESRRKTSDETELRKKIL